MRKFIIPLLSLSVANGLNAQQKQTAKQDTLYGKTLLEVVVTASKIKESILQSPVSVQQLTSQSIHLSPAPSFFDALENMQGVQMITPSLGFRILNARGFNNTTNVRFAQLVDGMDVASPHIGGPIGDALGPSDLDISKVELLPGMASALYGMNTVNGLANFITLNPFASPGVSVQQKTAVTHVADPNSPAKIFSETSLRWAQVVSPRFAFKINGTYSRGYDWISSDKTDLNPTANISSGLTGLSNPAYDAVSSYGNESSDRKTIALGGKSYVVGRTGYDEKDLVDYTLQNIKADLGLYYKFSPTSTLSYTYHFADLDNVYQRANRFRLQDYIVQQHGLSFQSKSIEAKVYINSENTGESYNLRSMGENIDRNYKPDTKWYADYTTGFNQATTGGAAVAAAHQQARTFADAGRYQPGTDIFNNVLHKLQDINNWDSGAALRVKASFIQSEIQVNLTEQYLSSLKENGFDILIGADNRTYIIQPDGNYFINPVGKDPYANIHYGKTGGYMSLSKKLFNNKLKLGTIIRADKNDYYDLKWDTRFSAVYSPSRMHNFRASFQSGYRFPSIFEAYSNVNSGGVKRVGGLPVMSSGIFENAYLATSITNFQAAVLNDINNNNLTKNQAIIKEQSLLKKNPYTYMTPERVRSFEVGYKGLFLHNRLFLDAEFYYSHYNGFIAQANMNVPKTSIPDSIPFYLYDKTLQNQYRMYTNSQSAINTYGFSFGLTYHFIKELTIKANTTYSKLKNTENEDGLEDGFNTPNWIVNVSASKQNIVKNIDAGITYKWQNGYYSQTFLATGNVNAYSTVDAQVSYNLRDINSSIKIGASNLLNHYYTSFLGGPSIGGMYYVTLTYGVK